MPESTLTAAERRVVEAAVAWSREFNRGRYVGNLMDAERALDRAVAALLKERKEEQSGKQA